MVVTEIKELLKRGTLPEVFTAGEVSKKIRPRVSLIILAGAFKVLMKEGIIERSPGGRGFIRKE